MFDVLMVLCVGAVVFIGVGMVVAGAAYLVERVYVELHDIRVENAVRRSSITDEDAYFEELSEMPDSPDDLFERAELYRESV